MGSPQYPSTFEAATDGAAAQGAEPIGTVCASCLTNWIKIRYEYEDGTGVGGANYVVGMVPTDDEPMGRVLAEGVTDENGEAHVSLPDGHDQVVYYFHDDPGSDSYEDPEATVPLREPSPGFFARLWDNITDAGDWIWGVLKGDFEEDPSTSQIIARMILTMIPGVDQLADGQDIVNVLYRLVWKREWNVPMHWIILVITLIGLIPTLGSLAKGILKLVLRRVADSGALRALYGIFNFFMRGNAHRWLVNFAHDLTGRHLDTALSLLDDMMDRVVAGMNRAKTRLGRLTGWYSRLDEGLEHVAAFRAEAPARLREAAEDLQRRLFATIAAGMTRIRQAVTRNADPHVVRQHKQNPERLSYHSGRGTASGRRYDPDAAGGPIRRSDWRTATIDRDGVADVRLHTDRFGDYPPNAAMVERLERISRGELEPTDYDLRYYTHERRELERYRNLGVPDDVDPGYDVWNNAHTATLEDYGISEVDADKNSTLYHPDTWGL
ncbi:hypothetical protein [Jannaschia sp. LMIT008]|uniref:hypothetical protein n=1 Tax=Jannaschia maritima TaxID=3032585 RepID=UPI002810B799|nr:hypothetical protein [Jannaschia sp. LMIT008]